ncbi:MAG: ATP-binding protein [Desulfobacteraceae bacterium]|jgi:two-component system NtrC family sensor kinase
MSTKNSKKKTSTTNGTNSNTELRSYFRQLERRFRYGLLVAFIVPLGALSAYFHFQFYFTLKETGKLNLTAIAESQRNTVDLFLQERLINIFALFHSSAFSLTPSTQHMERLLGQLRRASDAFIDVGFFTEEGIQIGYAGPYPFLHNKNYSKEDWFIKLMSPDQDHHISDIYLGFRNKLHFTIATKQLIDGKAYILRSTLDPDKFYLFLKTINHARGVESILINQNGRFQLMEPWAHQKHKKSEYIPQQKELVGAHILDRADDLVLVAHAWLTEVPWALLVSEPLSVAYAKFYHACRIMLIGSIIFVVIIVAGIWAITRKLIGKARDNAEKKEALTSQLLHASKLASLGELSTGMAHEINNPLAIVVATTDFIKDMLNPEFNIKWTPEQILEELATIKSAVFRAKGITQQLLDYGRKNDPQMSLTNINDVLEKTLGGFKERSLALGNINVVREFDQSLPDIWVDPNQLQQVFFNLINNAEDAISDTGTITLTTNQNKDSVRITITDTGIGMNPDQIKKIFDPFYTTKEVGKGTGLGLSVTIGIVESMGGRIEVQSMPGSGSAFIVVLPKRKKTEQTNKIQSVAA